MLATMTLTFRKIFFAALLVRILFLAVSSHMFDAYWDRPGFGGWEIGWIAKNLYQGRGFSSPFGEGTQPTAWVSPLIPGIWAAVMTLMGEASGRSELAIIFLQVLASSCAAALYVTILRQLSPHAPGWLVTGFAVAVVLWPESLLRINFLWYYAWQELSIAVLVWYGIRWATQLTARSAVELGVAGGVAALINVSPIPLFALALGVPALSIRSQKVFGYASVGGCVAILIVSPWLVRNRIVFGTFVPLRGNIGCELLQGNNPNGSIRQLPTSLHPFNNAEELQRYTSLGEVEYNREAARRANAWIQQNPTRAAVMIAQRVYVVWLTDITDKWTWSDRKWWEGRYSTVLQATTIVSAIAPLILAIAAVARAGVSRIPHRWLLFGVLLVPTPHYFTQVDDSYVAFLRPWLVLIALVCVSARNAHAHSRELPGLTVQGLPDSFKAPSQ